ncbi:MAG: gliding motility protein GldL, partial [Lachnospiraceae bacterium]|nr:gliding motility protein GldL [Lachnospiraceae bacterium]
GKIRKFGNVIERFLHGSKGQRFFNFAYSIGAAIVIWGALFKILHLPGGSTLLCIGMGTEIAMFILTAFDRPPKEYAWEEVFPVLDSHNADDRPDFENGTGMEMTGTDPDYDNYTAPQPATPAVPSLALSEEDTLSLRDSIQKLAAASNQLSQMAELTTATQDYLQGIAGIAEQMNALRATTEQLNAVSTTLLKSYSAITENSENIQQSSGGYVEQMEALNRNVSGLNTIYEIQLKSIASQLDSIDRVNRGLKDIRDMYEKSANESSRYCEETEKMARYMKQLNSVYEKMITAMTINMYNPMMGGGQVPAGGSVENPFANQANPNT